MTTQTLKELTDFYNGLPNVTPVKKFRDKQAAIKRIKEAQSSITREEWLRKGVSLLQKEFFAPQNYTLPKKLEVTCGFAKGGADTIGQCWDASATEDGTTHMFVCPTQNDPVAVLQIVLHEMIHASIGIDKKHGKEFRKLALEFGMAGKMRATYAEEGSELYSRLSNIAQELGNYPHSKINLKKKQKTPSETKWVNLYSVNDPKWKIWANIERILEVGSRPKDWTGADMVATKSSVEEQLQEAGI